MCTQVLRNHCLFVCLFSCSQVALGYTVHSRICRCSTLCRGAALYSVATAVAVTYSLNASLGVYNSSCIIFSMLHSVATALAVTFSFNASLGGYSSSSIILSMLHSVATAVAVSFLTASLGGYSTCCNIFSQCFTRWLQ